MGALNPSIFSRLSPVSPTQLTPRAQDPRLWEILGKSTREKDAPLIAILGFPCDKGVELNGGRTGAAQGPAKIREALYRLAPDAENAAEFAAVAARTKDYGDIKLSGDLAADQESLGLVVGELLTHGSIVVVLGGGHETAFGHFLGYAGKKTEVEIINFDAHPDVRPLLDGKGHSGSPFRQAIEHPSKCCKRYSVAGLQPQSSSAEHLAYVKHHGGDYIFRSGASVSRIDSLFTRTQAATYTSFDLDAIDQAWAPGVSAPATSGLDLGSWFHAASKAGASPLVNSIDIVELNPNFDRDGQTARVAAMTLWHFMRGVAERLANDKRPKLGFGR